MSRAPTDIDACIPLSEEKQKQLNKFLETYKKSSETTGETIRNNINNIDKTIGKTFYRTLMRIIHPDKCKLDACEKLTKIIENIKPK